MIVDRSHLRWIVAASGMVAGSALMLSAFPTATELGAWLGIVVGVLLALCAALAARRRLAAWPLGRASTWLRAHIWLGLAALPLAAMHADMRAGGIATTSIWVLLCVAVVSGIVGVGLQQVLPRVITARVPLETIYEQIPRVVAELRSEARERSQRAGDAVLTSFVERELDVYLHRPKRHLLGDRERARLAFVSLEKRVPPALHDVVHDLTEICEERRQLAEQERLHLWLHGWSLIHEPASYALLVIAGAHAVMAALYR